MHFIITSKIIIFFSREKKENTDALIRPDLSLERLYIISE